jgi:hypothetical protein
MKTATDARQSSFTFSDRFLDKTAILLGSQVSHFASWISGSFGSETMLWRARESAMLQPRIRREFPPEHR